MKNKGLNKKAFLLGEETLKIIIAVICIVFLIYILTAIYNANTSAKKIEEAKDILSRTEEIVLSLNEGESERQDISNPNGWHLIGFIGEDKPNSCLGNNCLCICSNSLIGTSKLQAKKCDEKGACLEINNLVISELDLKITEASDLLFIEIKKQNNQIFVEKSE